MEEKVAEYKIWLSNTRYNMENALPSFLHV